MRYMGSKARLAKHIVPILNSFKTTERFTYYEPLVGGANIIDTVDFSVRVGYDNNHYLIALLNYIAADGILPDKISEEEYLKVKNNKESYPLWYVGLVGFCSFGGRFFSGYPRGTPASNRRAGKTVDHTNDIIRNLEKQRKNLKGIGFQCADYLELDFSKEKCVIYCDPPYQNTTQYNTKLFGKFNTDSFWVWVAEQSKFNPVIVSEYNAPKEYTSIFQAQLKSCLQEDNVKISTEQLFIHKNWLAIT